MSVQTADDVADLFDETINVNEPLTWEFLGGDEDCPMWSQWRAYQAGDCARIPNEGIWCARRSIRAGEVSPGERGWTHAWERKSALLGADPAAMSAAAQRFSGRGGRPVLGADPAADAARAQRHRGGGSMIGALVADFHSIKAAYRDAANKGTAEEMETDIVGDDPVSQAARATKAIIKRARDEALPAAPPSRVMHYDATDEVSIDPVQLEILGEGGLSEADFPLSTELYRHFHGRNEPKFMRLDTEDSYRDFRADQSPEIAELRQKVATLEALVSAHTADGHGAQNVIIGLASDISNLQAQTSNKRVPLQMPPWAEGTWDCWREDGPDGGLVCCSIALPGHDGNVRICTAAAPVKNRVEDVVGYTHDIGCDVVTLLGVLPTIACMLAGRDLLTEMAAAAPAVLAHPGAKSQTPFIGKIVPANQPTLATLMALLQGAQAGNVQATKEWMTFAKIAQTNSGLAESMHEAKNRLIAAQTEMVGSPVAAKTLHIYNPTQINFAQKPGFPPIAIPSNNYKIAEVIIFNGVEVQTPKNSDHRTFQGYHLSIGFRGVDGRYVTHDNLAWVRVYGGQVTAPGAVSAAHLHGYLPNPGMRPVYGWSRR